MDICPTTPTFSPTHHFCVLCCVPRYVEESVPQLEVGMLEISSSQRYTQFKLRPGLVPSPPPPAAAAAAAAQAAPEQAAKEPAAPAAAAASSNGSAAPEAVSASSAGDAAPVEQVCS